MLNNQLDDEKLVSKSIYAMQKYVFISIVLILYPSLDRIFFTPHLEKNLI